MSINIFKKLNKNFLIGIFLAIIFLLPLPAKAELGDLDVVFSQNPLFQEISILPGDDASETITVTNNTEEEKTIGIEFTGTSTHELDEMIYFTIKEDNIIIFGGPSDPKTLAELLSLGEIILTNILPSSTTTLTIDAEFDTQADNPYQLKASIFDIKVGFIYFETNTFVIPDTNTNTPIVLGDEIIIKEQPPHAKILGVELPITGNQLLIYSFVTISILLLLIYTFIFIRNKQKINKNQ